MVAEKRRRGRPRQVGPKPAAVRRLQATEPKALGRPVFEGPVVVPLAQLEAERQRGTAAEQEATEKESLDVDALSRSIIARWFTSSLQ